MIDPRELADAYATEVVWGGYDECEPREGNSPKAFAALRAVLDLHRQHESLDATCVECSEREDTYDDMPWPCPTVHAITTALEAK